MLFTVFKMECFACRMFFLLLSLYVFLESKTTGERGLGGTTTPPSLPAGAGRVKSHMGAGGIISPEVVKKKKECMWRKEREKKSLGEQRNQSVFKERAL